MPLARLATHGAVLRLAEDDLRFSDDELAGFASADHLAGYEDGWTVRQIHALRDLVAA